MKKCFFLLLHFFSVIIYAQPGTLDTSFKLVTGTNDAIHTMSLQSDGKIIIGGWFRSINSIGNNNIARLNTDGSLDNSFDPGTGTNDMVHASSILPDGKIIIGGDFWSYNGTTKIRLARLFPDGSLDTNFNNGWGPDASVSSIFVQPDGKILITGHFTNYNNIPANHIARLNTDGTLDTSFNSGTGADWDVSTVSTQTDGKIVIGGNFTSYNGIARKNIARLNTDGSLDMTFNTGTGADSNVTNLSIQSDGKIIIGGYFDLYNGTIRKRIARLNTNGSLDTSFNADLAGIGSINNTALQLDGKIIVGGYFSFNNNTTIYNVIRLNTDGSRDTNFDVGNGIDSYGTVLKTLIQSDGKIIIGGGFETYTGVLRNNIARINSDILPPVAADQSVCLNAMVSDLKAEGTNLKWYSADTGGLLLDPNTILTSGPYFVSQTINGFESFRTKINVTVNQPTEPIFTPISDICPGTSLQPLPTTSNDGVTGTWLPALDNTKTVIYTFTPTPGLCAKATTLTIKVNSVLIPTFIPVAPICSGETIAALPTISDNNIEGTWAPAVNNTTTTTYTFTPKTGSCASNTTMTIIVNPLPDLKPDQDEAICAESNQMVQLNAGLLSGSESQYIYKWFRNNQLLDSESAYFLNTNKEGIYTCVVEDNHTGCTKTRTNKVIYSKTITIEKILISDFTANNIVTVVTSEEGNPEYSLDSPTGPFQDSNIFQNVYPGIHTVFVNDKNGCGSVSKTIAVIGAPPYFTPNDDGHNDYWKIKGIDEQVVEDFNITIFDRYGKLLKVFANTTSEGWDGKYNGHQMPSDDYWFVANLKDRTVKGHFALKR